MVIFYKNNHHNAWMMTMITDISSRMTPKPKEGLNQVDPKIDLLLASFVLLFYNLKHSHRVKCVPLREMCEMPEVTDTRRQYNIVIVQYQYKGIAMQHQQ